VTLALILGVVAVLCLCALAAALLSRWDRFSLFFASTGVVVACGAGAVVSAAALVRMEHASAASPFATPLGALRVGLDPLSSFFLLCVFLVSGLAALYGAGYLASHTHHRTAPAAGWFCLLVASMALVVLSRDAVAFLGSWELMSVSAFFLVTYENERQEVRRAGMTYLVASHAGVAVLFLMFTLLAHAHSSFAFAAWSKTMPHAGLANTCFVLALAGFGSKAGFWPVHVWLPDAHPAAPSHVSAAMSGVMIKMGIYGLLRTLDWLGPVPLWWGALLLGIGVASGVLGVLHALAQHDLKRLLAYHSVENIGIIAAGLGLGLVGRSLGCEAVALLGLSGGLLHVLNHGLFKGLLFQGAGSVLSATGSRQIDALGGLMRRMPHTATAFLVGSAAIAGLPPLNGFVSELLIFVAAFRGAALLPTSGAVAALVVMTALALISGLAAACFVKAFGVVFLGQPRSVAAARAHEVPRSMTAVTWTGAGLCAVVGFAAAPVVRLIAPVAREIAGGSSVPLELPGLFGDVARVAAVLVAIVAGLGLLRWAILRTRTVQSTCTWDCGYAEPTARMQYTAASFAEPVLWPFDVVFRKRSHGHPPEGAFPTRAVHDEHLEDRAEQLLTRWVSRCVASFRALGFLQRGRVQLYLVYVLATLVLLLAWQAIQGAP
jgi:hydrogenase-4 component B